MRASKPDAVLGLLMSGQVGVFAKQLRNAGFKSDFFGYESFEDPHEIELAKEAIEEAWFVTGGAAEAKFTERFKKFCPDLSPVTASNVYDAVSLMNQALINSIDSSSAAAYIRKLKDYHGASGVFSSTGEGKFTLPAQLKVIRGGKYESLIEGF